MTREFLKEMLVILRPSRITPDMYANPLQRSMERIRERARGRNRSAIRALYDDLSLTDEQRRDGYYEARKRQDVALEKLRPLEDRFELEVEIPRLVRTGVLRSATPKLRKRRA